LQAKEEMAQFGPFPHFADEWFAFKVSS